FFTTMMRFLQFINLAGVLALGVLCAAQWHVNRRCNEEIIRLETIRIDQADKIEKQDSTIASQSGDLETLREHLKRLAVDAKETEGKLALAEREAAEL